MRELSKKVYKFNEAEQFVFISEQSAQFFRKIFYKPLQHNSFGRPNLAEVNKLCSEPTLYLGLTFCSIKGRTTRDGLK